MSTDVPAGLPDRVAPSVAAGTARQRPSAAAPFGLLGVLQYADSLFPSGATAFSWGLESMHVDGLANGPDAVLALMKAMIEQRWAGFDRPLMHASRDAVRNAPADVSGMSGMSGLEGLIAIDNLCEASMPGQGARAASRRLGFTQLRVHAELGLAIASRYLDQVRAGRSPGHLAVVQGFVWQALELTADEGDTMSAFSLCTSMVGAAMRLGLLGHLDAQRLLVQMRGPIAAAIAGTPGCVDDLWTGAPALEIAAMRHEPRSARLFAS